MEGDVLSSTKSDLDRQLALPGTQAVVLRDDTEPSWHHDITSAVEDGSLLIARTEVPQIDPDRAATWIDAQLASSRIDRSARDGLCSDIAELVHLAERVSGTRSHLLRVFTESPTDRCSFHVDTVPPGAPVFGVLKVYNGRGTRWLPSQAVSSMREFYNWLQRRERESRSADASGQGLRDIDSCPSFLLRGHPARVVDSGATIVFRHLHVDRHWEDHAPDDAWIHASPSVGPTRLVVNVTPDRSPMHSPS